jgi:hypothetical protein
MNPELGVIDGTHFRALRELKNDEYNGFQNAKKNLMQFSHDLKSPATVLTDIEEYKELLQQCIEDYKKAKGDWFKMDRIVVNINKGILSVLNSFRLFLDHSETRLKKRFGKNSNRVEKFKKACAEEYDNNFSYRFMYRLRNYAQHCGMPIRNLSLKSSLVGEEERVEYGISVNIDRDSLIDSFDGWGAQVKEELLQLPPYFEINPYILGLRKSIEWIQLVCVEDDFPSLVKSAEYIREMMRQLEDIQGVPCIFQKISRSDKTGIIELTVEDFPLHLIDMVDYIVFGKGAE